MVFFRDDRIFESAKTESAKTVAAKTEAAKTEAAKTEATKPECAFIRSLKISKKPAL